MPLIRRRSVIRNGAALYVPAGGGGGGSPTWTKKDGAVHNSGFSATETFSSVAINNSSSSDLIVVFISSNTRRVGGVTIGGNAMTLVVESSTGANDNHASIWQYTGSTFTTPNIVVSPASSTLQFVGMSCGVLTGVNTTASSTAVRSTGFHADPQTTATALTVPSSGFGLAMIGVTGGSATSATWNTGTEDFDLSSGTDYYHSSAYISASGSQTPSVSGFAFFGDAMAAAAWGP